MGVFDEDKEYFNEILPYKQEILEEHLKYLGFFLKPITYLKKDWEWLIAKVKKGLMFGAIIGSQGVGD
jgi:hypothetical protein